jgi:drug/metabolite transporter (DMT)-like permease
MSGTSAPSMLSPKVLVPFMLTGTIWGSTWFVITGQISDVPAAWGVFFRFMLATPAMFALAMIMGNRLKLNRSEHLLALGVGIAQFSGNFLFVYHSEQHITSGIVAVMFALLMVPNALFARVFIGEKVQGGFIGGSLVAIAGVSLLLVHEWNAAPLGGDVGLGIVLAICGMLAASIANVVQANPTGRGVPMVSLLAWAMLYGTAFDLVYALATEGAPQVPDAWQFWAGTAYLAIVGSVVTFPLHYNLVREIGAGKTAYNGIVTVCVAMLLSTLFEGFKWDALSTVGMALALTGMGLALRARRVKAVQVQQSGALRR